MIFALWRQHGVPLLIGAAVGCAAAVVLECGRAGYHGRSADPRCVYAWRGYVEVHVLGATQDQDRIRCQYRPDITERR